MIKLSPEELESIRRRIDFLRIEASDIPGFNSMTHSEYLSDRGRRRNLERLVENVINAAADIAKILLAAGDLPVPDTYRDTLLQLGAAGFLKSPLAEKLAEMTRLRNVLAHQYLDIRWPALRDFIKNAPDTLQQFLEVMEELLNQSD